MNICFFFSFFFLHLPQPDEAILSLSNTTEIEDSTGEKMIVSSNDVPSDEQMEVSEEKPEDMVPGQKDSHSPVAT